jgi:hypothetical protein
MYESNLSGFSRDSLMNKLGLYLVTHFPAPVMLECAKVVLNWCKEDNGYLTRSIASA